MEGIPFDLAFVAILMGTLLYLGRTETPLIGDRVRRRVRQPRRPRGS